MDGPVRLPVLLATLLLINVPFTVTVAAADTVEQQMPIQNDESIFTAREICGFAGYSKMVQLAFNRVTDLSQYSDDQLTEVDWMVVSPASDCSSNEDQVRLIADSVDARISSAPLLEDAWIWSFPQNSDPIKLLSEMETVEMFYPLIESVSVPRMVPNDPYFSDQWHLRNTGQQNGVSGEDVNITGAWDQVLGTGVVIGIVDDGLEHDHEDLSTNYKSSLDYDFCGNDGNPSPSSWDGHGTAAAGVAAASGNNGKGVSGAAPDASLAGLLLIACTKSDSDEGSALSHQRQNIDIYSNSWGPSDDGRTLEAPGPNMMAAFESDVYSGRGGLGNIITWAAGNGLS